MCRPPRLSFHKYVRNLRARPSSFATGFPAMTNNAPDAPDWNLDDSLFTFTRGRFIFNEKHEVAQRTIRFNMNELARIAASSVGADRCVHIQKCPDGLYNKAYVFRMEDGREVIGKVPNPNAGLPHYNTASEVATMDFMRNVLATPAPKVLAWNSRVESSAVGAEYIIMEKAEGIPLRHAWNSLALSEKLKVLVQIFDLMKVWLARPFPGYGSLYYAADVPGTSLPVDAPALDRQFAIGPATGRDWYDSGRQNLKCDRGPWTSALDYRRAVGGRERTTVQQLSERTKQMVMLTGPGLYQPSVSKKLWALDAYHRLLGHLLPRESDPEMRDMLSGRLWHDDLHDENVFVDPANPTRITTIIDWQFTQIAPLFDHHMDPAFLDYRGPDVGDNLGRPPRLDTTGLSAEEKAAAREGHFAHALMIGWRRLLKAKSPTQYRTAAFQVSTAGNLLHVARRVYDVGEAHLAALVLALRDAWPGSDFPVALTPEKVDEISRDVAAADRGVELLAKLEEQMGEAWPDKGLVESGDYNETKIVLASLRDKIAEQLCGNNEDARRDFLKQWPFDG